MTNSSNVLFDECVRSVEGTGSSELDNLFVNGYPVSIEVEPDKTMEIQTVEILPDNNLRINQNKYEPIGTRSRGKGNTSMHNTISAFAVKAKEELKIPNNPKQAMESAQSEQWEESIKAEINSWVKNKCITVIKRSDVKPYHRVLDHKWVFKIKQSIDGVIERFKARCNILGNLQREGFDYDETFAPVVRYTTVRSLIALAASRNYVLHQMDVDTAFLYGELPDEIPIYTGIPHGYVIPDEFKHMNPKDLVAKVNKAIYGLKQSPRLWNLTLDKTMKSKGFTKSKTEPCLYYRERGGEVVYVAVFVDDLVIAGSTLSAVNEFKSDMKSTYNMKDLGELKYSLGIQVYRNADKSITLNQSKYIDDVLRRFGLLNAHSEPTPMIQGIKLSKSMCVKTEEQMLKAQQFPYREIVGSVMYLMISTRPDISYAVGQLAMYMNDHGPQHHAAALHLLRYIKGTRDLGITYRRTENEEITGYSDSDWAANVDTRRSTM